MILDKIENIKMYIPLVPAIANCHNIITHPEQVKETKYFEGGYVSLYKGYTREEQSAYFESHKKYIDIQYILKGSEELEWNTIKNLELNGEYREDIDMQFYKGTGSHIVVNEGMFHIHFPSDGHKSLFHRIEEKYINKLTFKIEVKFDF